jgi:hypothetical protein
MLHGGSAATKPGPIGYRARFRGRRGIRTESETARKHLPAKHLNPNEPRLLREVRCRFFQERVFLLGLPQF